MQQLWSILHKRRICQFFSYMIVRFVTYQILEYILLTNNGVLDKIKYAISQIRHSDSTSVRGAIFFVSRPRYLYLCQQLSGWQSPNNRERDFDES